MLHHPFHHNTLVSSCQHTEPSPVLLALVTFLFDSCFVWCVVVPLAFCLSRFTALAILPLYAICQGTDVLKTALGAWMVGQGKWIRNLTKE